MSLASTRVRDEDEDRQCSLAGRALCVYISARPMCGRGCRVVPREGRSQPNSGTKPELSRHSGHGWRQGVAQIAGCPPSVTPRGRFWHRNRVVPRKSASAPEFPFWSALRGTTRNSCRFGGRDAWPSRKSSEPRFQDESGACRSAINSDIAKMDMSKSILQGGFH